MMLVSFIKNNYFKYREVINYLIFGFLTTVINLIAYYLLTSTIFDPSNSFYLQVANVISWCVSVVFAYVTNRKYVFNSKSNNINREFLSFISSRIVTLLLDMFIMWLGVSFIHMNDKICKLISQVLVIISNYLFSKLLVFRKDKL